MTVREYLEAVAKFDGQLGDTSGYAYPSIPTFLLREGRSFEVKPKPRDIRYGAYRGCFANATKVVMHHGYGYGADSEAHRFTYCEGFAAGIIPVHHAWVLDNEDGRAFDPTWRWTGGKGSPARDAEYFGVAIPWPVVSRALIGKGTYGVLEYSPLYRKPWSETISDDWATAVNRTTEER